MLQVSEGSSQVWGEGDRPTWLVPDELQPKKREWSPARDRLEAELELKARLQEQKQLGRRNRLRFFFLPFIWTWSLLQALVDVGRNRPDVVQPPRHEPPVHSATASLESLPTARPHAPAEEKAVGPVIGWAPPPTEEIAPVAYEVPTAMEPSAPTAPPEHPEIHWPETVEPAAPPAAPGPQAPPKDWRPEGEPAGSEAGRKPPPAPAPPTHWPGDEPVEGAPSELVAPAPEPAVPAAEVPVPQPPVAAIPPDAEVAAAAVPAPAPQPQPEPLPAQPTQQLGAGELVGVILGTCLRSAGAEVGVLVLLQDDVLVVRASSGIEPDTAAHLALETLGDLCLDVIGSATPVRAYEANPGPPDPFHPRAILCVPVLIAGAGAGAVLLAGYAPGREFTAVHERLVANVGRNSGPVLAKAGAYHLILDRPGDRWRRLDQVGSGTAPAAAEAPPITEHGTGEIPGSPMSTMTLDPEAMRRLIAGAKAARVAQEAEAAAEAEAAERAARAAAAARLPQPPPQVEPEVEEPAGWRLPDWGAQAPPAAEVEPLPDQQTTRLPLSQEPTEPAAPQPKRPGWRDRVGSRMTRISEQREEDRARYRTEILAAVRNLSWDGYQALIADIYRRKAFEVFPPPVSGSDLDVIDLVVDRDGKRMLINCQLRGEMDIPAAAVTEMGNVVYNYSVAGAYLIADGSFGPDASEAAPASGVVLIDGEALIDLVIETTLKDESKPSGFSRLAKRFARAS